MYGDEAKEMIKELHALLTDRPEFIYTVQVCMGRAEGASCGAGTGWQAARVVGRGRRLSLSLIWWWVGARVSGWESMATSPRSSRGPVHQGCEGRQVGAAASHPQQDGRRSHRQPSSGHPSVACSNERGTRRPHTAKTP